MTLFDYMKSLKPDITEEEAEFIIWEETAYPACGTGEYFDKQLSEALGVDYEEGRLKKFMGWSENETEETK